MRIGTRGSLLALAQAREIQRRLSRQNPNLDFRLVVVKTKGDEFQSVALFKKTNVGVFTKEIEKRLLRNEVDIAVHSLKDLPTDIPNRLTLAAFPKRLDVCDVVISRNRLKLGELPRNATVGTGSPRRTRQILRIRPDLKMIPMRGNLDTRVAKVLQEKKVDAVVVAKAGLLRLKKYLKYTRTISPADVLPAVGQGALGIEARKNDKFVLKILRPLNHRKTEFRALAERSFLNKLQGGCRVPVGIYSMVRENKIHLKAAVFSTTNGDFLTDELSLPLRQHKKAGEILAKRLLQRGAKKFLEGARIES